MWQTRGHAQPIFGTLAASALILSALATRCDGSDALGSGLALALDPSFPVRPYVCVLYTYGLRNPFRMTVRPGTREVWIGDVGWRLYDEINRVPTRPSWPAS
jgi:hypothetical protein